MDRAFRTLIERRLNQRRDARVRYRAPFRLFWAERMSQMKYVRAASSDISERGLCLETSQSIPVGTRLALRAETGELFGCAQVRHSTRRGLKYVVGIEFGYGLLDVARDLVREVYNSPSAK
jgi:PilZ domain